MITCPACDYPLDVEAKAAGSLKCSACSWEDGEMCDGEEPQSMVITDLEYIPEGYEAA